MNKAAEPKLQVIKEFLSYLLDDRHFSPYTARCYGVDLRQYIEYLGESLNIHINEQQEADALRLDPIGSPSAGRLFPIRVLVALSELEWRRWCRTLVVLG